MVGKKPTGAIRRTKTTAKATVAEKTAPEVPQELVVPAKPVRRKEMVERIVASSGLKPNVVKTALDAVLSELGNALSKGEDLVLQPLGKVTVNRTKQVNGKEILICKIRRNLPVSEHGSPLDAAAE